MVSTTVNAYLDGNFAPVRQEITAENLKVIGELPPDISGMFVRNGPNPQFPPIGQYHWFDGDGMLHGVRIHNGKASYRNRYVRTLGYQIENEAGKAIWTGLLEPPQMDNPYGPYKNAANTALVWHGGQLLALWEGGEPYAIELPELDTMGSYNYNGKLTSAFTAHPKVDPVTGEMMFFGYSIAEPPYLKYTVVSAAGELLQTVPIDLPVAVMMHDFAITEHYSIFMDLPLTFRPERMQQGKPLLMFESELPSRFGILPRHGDNSSIQWFESKTCFVPHTLNAYEVGDEIILMGCRMTSNSALGLSEAPNDDLEVDVPRLYQWRFNLMTGNVTETMLNDIPIEFPRVNETRLGRQAKYGYAAKISSGSVILWDGLIKYDLESGKFETQQFAAGRYGGDLVFVPRPSATVEDDGWLLTFVHDENKQQSELVVFDAQNLTDEPIARVMIPQRVPYGFHAIWISEAQLQNSIVR